MRTNKLLYSIRWQFAVIYLVLVGIVFGVVSVAISSLVEDYLVDQRIKSVMNVTNNTAVQMASYLSDYDAGSMYNIAVKNGNDSGGRFLVLNRSGIVVVDSFSDMNGVKLSDREDVYKRQI